MVSKDFKKVEEKIFRALVESKAVYPGPFIRKDGMVLPFWDDCQKLWSNPRLFHFYIEELSKIVKRLPYKFIVGAATTGIPLAAAIAFKTGKSFSFVRKVKKGYSAKQLIDGFIPKGSKVILVDDALVAGEMKGIFTKQIERAGSQVVALVTFIDCGLKEGRDYLLKKGIEFYTLYIWPDLIDCFYKRKLITEEFYSILYKFIKQPYNWHKDKKVWSKFIKLKKIQPLWCKKI